jgi:hypothetical protein
MAGGFRRMPVAAEVDAFDAEVGGNDNLVTGGRSQEGGIVADSQGKLWKRAPSGLGGQKSEAIAFRLASGFFGFSRVSHGISSAMLLRGMRYYVFRLVDPNLTHW